MPGSHQTQGLSKVEGAGKKTSKKTNTSKGSGGETPSRSSNPGGTGSKNSSPKRWDDGLRTMYKTQKKVDKADREDNGVKGMLADAAKNVVDPKKQNTKHGLLK